MHICSIILVFLSLASVAWSRSVVATPDPYWHELAFEGLEDARQKRAVPISVDYVPDPNPEAVPIPAGAPNVTFGLVISDMSGYDDAEFNILHHWGVRTWQWRVNTMGKLVLNGTVHYADVKVLSGGPDCGNFLIAYEYLITVAQVDFLFHPVNPDCQRLAFLAEAYSIPLVNAPDYALAIYQDIPQLPYYNLTQLYSVAANYSLLAPSCLVPLVDAGAKTIALMSAGTIGQGVIPATNAVIGPLGLVKVLNDTLLDTDKQLAASQSSDPCSYVRSYIETLKQLKPDIFVYSMGPPYTDEFTRCMRLASYYPPAYWIFTANALVGTSDAWMTSYSLTNDFWRDGTNTSDPVMVSVTNYTADFVRQWGSSLITLIGYSATSSTAGTVMVEAINLAGSIDSTAFRAAMHTINISSIIGETYLVPGTQIFYNPFLCRQQGNGPYANDSYIIYPFNAPSAIAVVYPADVTVDPAFAASLLDQNWWTTGRIVGVTIGVVMFVLLLVAVAGLAYYLFVVKYHAIFIPKSDVPSDTWGE